MSRVLNMYFLVYTCCCTKSWEKSATLNGQVCAPQGGKNLLNRGVSKQYFCMLYGSGTMVLPYDLHLIGYQGHIDNVKVIRGKTKNTHWKGFFYLKNTCDGYLTAIHGLMNRCPAVLLDWWYSEHHVLIMTLEHYHTSGGMAGVKQLSIHQMCHPL